MRTIKLCGVLFLSVVTALAQSAGSGVLQGRVNDASGRAIAAAKISVREVNTSLARETFSNAEGQFQAGALPVGTYRVDVAAQGFAAGVIENLELSVGVTKTLNVSLQVASVSAQITVEAAADLVNRADPSNSISINSRSIEDLPIRARNFTEFVQS